MVLESLPDNNLILINIKSKKSLKYSASTKKFLNLKDSLKYGFKFKLNKKMIFFN